MKRMELIGLMMADDETGAKKGGGGKAKCTDHVLLSFISHGGASGVSLASDAD